MRTRTLILVAVAATMPAAQEPPRFEAVSIRQNNDVNAAMNNRYPPGRMILVNYSPFVLIQEAFGVTSDRLLNVPEWATRERFDIEATHTPPNISITQRMRMLEPVLVERFGLKAHRETREMPVYALVRIRPDTLGPGLRPSTRDCTPKTDAEGKRIPDPECGIRFNQGIVSGYASQFAGIPRQFGIRDRPIIDRTGLQGAFEIELKWLPEGAPDDGQGVSIFTAVQEQLGLRLERTTAPLDVLVVDSLSRPTPN